MAGELDPQKQMEQAIGGAVYAVVALFIQSGLTPTDSMRLASLFVIENALGRDAVRALGLPRGTATRWRREIARAAQSPRAQELVDNPAVELETLNGLLPAMGLRDLRIIRVGDDDV